MPIEEMESAEEAGEKEVAKKLFKGALTRYAKNTGRLGWKILTKHKTSALALLLAAAGVYQADQVARDVYGGSALEGLATAAGVAKAPDMSARAMEMTNALLSTPGMKAPASFVAEHLLANGYMNLANAAELSHEAPYVYDSEGKQRPEFLSLATNMYVTADRELEKVMAEDRGKFRTMLSGMAPEGVDGATWAKAVDDHIANAAATGGSFEEFKAALDYAMRGAKGVPRNVLGFIAHYTLGRGGLGVTNGFIDNMRAAYRRGLARKAGDSGLVERDENNNEEEGPAPSDEEVDEAFMRWIYGMHVPNTRLESVGKVTGRILCRFDRCMTYASLFDQAHRSRHGVSSEEFKKLLATANGMVAKAAGEQGMGELVLANGERIPAVPVSAIMDQNRMNGVIQLAQESMAETGQLINAATGMIDYNDRAEIARDLFVAALQERLKAAEDAVSSQRPAAKEAAPKAGRKPVEKTEPKVATPAAEGVVETALGRAYDYVAKVYAAAGLASGISMAVTGTNVWFFGLTGVHPMLGIATAAAASSFHYVWQNAAQLREQIAADITQLHLEGREATLQLLAARYAYNTLTFAPGHAFLPSARALVREGEQMCVNYSEFEQMSPESFNGRYAEVQVAAAEASTTDNPFYRWFKRLRNFHPLQLFGDMQSLGNIALDL